jgi:hypothetical protein
MRRQIFTTTAILAALVLTQAIVIMLLLFELGTKAEAAGWASAVILPLLAGTYDILKKHNVHFYLFTQRVRNYFGGRSATWNFAVRLYGSFTAASLDELVHKIIIIPTLGVGAKVSRPHDAGRIVSLRGGLNLEITLQASAPEAFSSDQQPYIYILIHNLRVSYNEAADILDKEIIPLITRIESALRASDRLYGMTVEVDKMQNPFMGLYLDRFDPDEIENFQVVLLLRDFGEQDTVTISDTSIEISAHSAHAISSLGKEFLTFHPNLHARLRNG